MHKSPYGDDPGLDRWDDAQWRPGRPPMSAGLVKHVPAVGVLSITYGLGELLIGMFYTGLFLLALTATPVRMGPPVSDAQAQIQMWQTMIAGLLHGFGPLIAGSVRILAGLRIYTYRSRWLGFVSLATGCLSIFGCCLVSPLGLALNVYGLVVLVNPQVGLAFRMRKQGATPAEIYAAFTPEQKFAPPPPPPPQQQPYQPFNPYAPLPGPPSPPDSRGPTY